MNRRRFFSCIAGAPIAGMATFITGIELAAPEEIHHSVRAAMIARLRETLQWALKQAQKLS